MKIKQNPLLDFKFLNELDKYHNRVTYARITSLTLDHYPVEQIEGIVTGGSISLDGASAVRRVCSLTITTNHLNITNVYWALTTRIKVEIGLTNSLIDYQKYDDIIWFPQGVFVLTDFKTQAKVNQYTINISAKDKMCLLNGDVSGNFNAETQLDSERHFLDDGGYEDEKKPLSYIIREMVHHYAQESFHNIVIKDIDTLSLKMLTNRTGHTFYLIQNKNTEQFVDIFCSGVILSQKDYYYKDTPDLLVNFSILKDDFVFKIDLDEDNTNLVDTVSNDLPTILINEENTEEFYVIKIEDGEDIGYQLTETYYPDELIAGVNETVTSILDKIIKTFGAYEYFYNIEGQFVFQAKQTYVNTAWNNIIKIEDENYVEPFKVSSSVKYYFDGGAITTSYQNNPQMGKIKNDFTVWGVKKISGLEIPIHARYAIDKKPEFYYSYDGIGFISTDFLEEILKIYQYSSYDKKQQIITINNEIYKIVDWREIIYQMAKDYYQHNHEDEFEIMIQRNNYKTFITNEGISIKLKPYEQGKTGYEQYYHDIEGFWRTLYLPEDDAEKVRIFNDRNIQIIDKDNFYKIERTKQGLEKTYIGPWNKNILENPSNLLFWFDFFDADSLGLGQFSVPAIGTRPKNEKNDSIRAIIYKDVPDVIFISEEEQEKYSSTNRLLTGYSYLLNDTKINNYLADGRIGISTRSITIQETINDLLYKYAYANEQVSISSIPIYYLQPNTIISIRDEDRGVHGYYIINKITLPLDYKGEMKITAIKVPERIY